MVINTHNIDVHIRTKALARLFNSYVDMTLNCDLFQTLNIYVDNTSITMDYPLVKHQLNCLFANNNTTDEDIYPPIISRISEAQLRHKLLNRYVP